VSSTTYVHITAPTPAGQRIPAVDAATLGPDAGHKEHVAVDARRCLHLHLARHVLQPGQLARPLKATAVHILADLFASIDSDDYNALLDACRRSMKCPKAVELHTRVPVRQDARQKLHALAVADDVHVV